MSTRVARAGLTNVIYVRASVEDPPAELVGVADRVTAILPWGSLLAAFARPVVPLLENVRRLCAPGLPVLDDEHFEGALAEGYAAAGFRVTSVRALTAEELPRWPSSWAKRLAFGRPRPVYQIEATTSAATGVG